MKNLSSVPYGETFISALLQHLGHHPTKAVLEALRYILWYTRQQSK